MRPKNQAPEQNQSTAKKRPQKPDLQDKTSPTLETHPGVLLQRAELDPGSLTPGDIQQLQRTIGNQGTGQILTQTNQRQPTGSDNKPITPSFSPHASLQRMLTNRGIQAKLTVNAPGDQYEQEADTVAKQVVNTINTPTPQTVPTTQRQEDDELAMTKPDIQRSRYDNDGTVDESVETSIQQARGSGQPLTDTIRGPMEQAFGADFSSVNIHTDTQSHQLNQAVQAKAFTTGQDIFFRQGEYNPGSKDGQELIAHELTHVVQQNKGNNLRQQDSKQGQQVTHQHSNKIQRKRSNDGSVNFIIYDLKLNKSSSMSVTTEFAEPSEQDDAEHQFTPGGIDFSATVGMTSDSTPSNEWRVGWVQIVYPDSTYALYQDRNGRSLKVISTLPQAMRDAGGGDAPWGYEGSKVVTPGKTNNQLVETSDRPNLPLHFPTYQGDGGGLIYRGLPLVECGGRKSFSTWLIAYNPVSQEMVFLYYVKWEVIYSGQVVSNNLQPIGNAGLRFTEEGEASHSTGIFFAPSVEEDSFDYIFEKTPGNQNNRRGGFFRR